MAKAVVFEGSCPACGDYAGYGQLALTLPEHVMNSLKGGAIGAGSVLAADMIIPRILPALSPTVRALITGAAIMGASWMLRNRYPDIALGMALGGGSIVVYKLIAALTGKLFAVSGFESEGLGETGQTELPAPESEEVTVEEKPYGVIVPEVEYGQQEIIVE